MNEYFNIPTIFKNVKMRSRLESNIAYFLENLNIKWEYEPQGFLLSKRHYLVDFYLPELNLWVEVKPEVTDYVLSLLKEFVKNSEKEILLITPNKLIFLGESYGEEPVCLGKCSNCNGYFFCGVYGSYHCRKCKEHNGDHDLVVIFEEFEDPNTLNFSKIDSIIHFLNLLEKKEGKDVRWIT